jgi:hypothetical protein
MGEPGREPTIEGSKAICLSGARLSALVVVGRDDAMRAKAGDVRTSWLAFGTSALGARTNWF